MAGAGRGLQESLNFESLPPRVAPECPAGFGVREQVGGREVSLLLESATRSCPALCGLTG